MTMTATPGVSEPSIFRRLQQWSGLACGLFLLLHVLTVASLVVDPGAFEAALFKLRELYRPSDLVESLVVWTPLTLHLLASWGVAHERRKDRAIPDLTVRLVRWSGTLLLVLLGVHVLIDRILPGMEGYSATASYVAFAVESWPWWVLPYYLLLVLAGACHAGMGAALALGELGVLVGARRSQRIAGLTWSVILGLALLLGFGRVALDAPNMDPSYYASYQRLYERYLPFLHPQNPRVR